MELRSAPSMRDLTRFVSMCVCLLQGGDGILNSWRKKMLRGSLSVVVVFWVGMGMGVGVVVREVPVVRHCKWHVYKPRSLDTDAVPEYRTICLHFLLSLLITDLSKDFCLFITNCFPREHEQSFSFFLWLWCDSDCYRIGRSAWHYGHRVRTKRKEITCV